MDTIRSLFMQFGPFDPVEKVQREARDAEQRLEKLQAAFDKAYPRASKHRDNLDIAILLLKVPMTQIIMGEHAAAIVELHAAIERLVITFLPKWISKDTKSRLVVTQLVGRRNLPEMAPLLATLDVWTREDEKAAAKLTDLRNGIAHKNERVVERALGRTRSPKDTGSFIRFEDAASHYVVGCLLLSKLVFNRRNRSGSGSKAKAGSGDQADSVSGASNASSQVSK